MNTTVAVEPTSASQRADKQTRMQLHRLLLGKMRAAGWQTSWDQMVDRMKREFLTRYAGVSSSSNLHGAALSDAVQALQKLAIAKPSSSLYTVISTAQVRAIVKLGRYVIGPVYGDKWIWTVLQEYVDAFLADSVAQIETGEKAVHRVRRIDELTNAEARYVIQRLEKIEFKLKQEGRI